MGSACVNIQSSGLELSVSEKIARKQRKALLTLRTFQLQRKVRVCEREVPDLITSSPQLSASRRVWPVKLRLADNTHMQERWSRL